MRLGLNCMVIIVLAAVGTLLYLGFEQPALSLQGSVVVTPERINPGRDPGFCAALWAYSGSNGSVIVGNRLEYPVKVRVEIQGNIVESIVDAGERAVIARLRFESSGLYALRVWVEPAVPGVEGYDVVGLNVVVSSGKGVAMIYYFVPVVVVACTMYGILNYFMSSRGLTSRLEQALLAGFAGGLLLPASQGAPFLAAVPVSCGFIRVECPVDSLITEVIRPAVGAGEALVIVAILLGTLALMYEAGYGVEQFDAMIASFSLGRVWAYALSAYASLASGVAASLAGIVVSSGVLQIAARFGSVEELLSNVPWLIDVFVFYTFAPIVATTGFSIVLRRSKTVAFLLILAVLSLPGNLITIHYSGCLEKLSISYGARGSILVVAAIVALILSLLVWKRR